ncbi:alpha/beta-hydrolase [Multifurca ochricompacta]|uniref:Alpha/beta-hydrolase n=1 Tax=Multifurca ochricompacta TaxID=376703 RepID=A0AAD4LTX8_9AGAM|nr:alpha/beta-hydrolase [Multifurca ochricompacta]
MNPADPSSFNHRTEQLSTGRTYHFVDQKPALTATATAAGHSHDELTILCVHGFPDIWYGWRYQIGPWVRAGYRVVVPDMLGYGGTDKPLAVEEYSTRRLSDDLVALLDLIGVSKAIVIGHDWGSYTAGRFALWHPDRLLALGLLSVPFSPPNKEYISLKDVVKRVPNYAYQMYFANPESTKEIEANFERFLRLMYGIEVPEINPMVGENMREVIVNPREFEYVGSQMRSNMNGPLSYYRTSKIRFEEEKAAGLPSYLSPDLPVLHIWGTKDGTATPGMLTKMRESIGRLEEIRLPEKRHWIMVQGKDEVSREVLKWLNELGLGLVNFVTKL